MRHARTLARWLAHTAAGVAREFLRPTRPDYRHWD